MTIIFEEFDPVLGFAPVIKEEPFKLDPNMPLELPGLLPKPAEPLFPYPPVFPWDPGYVDPEPEIPPYYEDDDGDGIPNVFDPDHPLYQKPEQPGYDPNIPSPDLTPPDEPEPIFDPTRITPWPDLGDPDYEYPDDWRTPFFEPFRFTF